MPKRRDERANPGSRRPLIAATAACALPVLLALALAPAAQAGQWHQYTCREPNGTPAPTDGWTGSISGSYICCAPARPTGSPALHSTRTLTL
jgi:hypothetical protein